MSDKNKRLSYLTADDRSVIRDALEMRIRECKKHSDNLKNGASEAERRLAFTFQNIGDRAQALYDRMEEEDSA